jgi:hypothetical protein
MTTLTLPKGITEAAKVFGAALEGDYSAQGRMKSIVTGGTHLSEAISTSDLAKSFLMGLNQNLQAQYAAQPSTWQDFSQRIKLNDFKPEFYRELVLDNDTADANNGGVPTAPWSLPNVPELTEYPSFGYATAAKAIQTLKKGARIPFSWEAVINDEWHLLEQLPQWMLRYAKNSEDTSTYSVLASATGPNATTFSSANGNINSRSGALFNQEYKLSLNSLALAKRDLQNRKINGQPSNIASFRLIVPRAMEEFAQQLLKIQTLTLISADGRTRATGEVSNSNVKLTVSDWLPRIDVSANNASTWYLVPDGGFDGTRMSIVTSFLRGHEIPELRQSGNTGLYLGGGAVPSLEGSLLNDDIEYRIRHVVAASYLNADLLLSSNGTYASDAPATSGI